MKKGKQNGFFVEAGAGDGEIISNSLYFELKYGVNTIIYNKNLELRKILKKHI